MTTINKVDVTGAVVAPDLQPLDASPATNPALDQPMETPPDSATMAGKRLEKDLEASYYRGELDKAQHGSPTGVLHDKHSHDPAANAAETRRTAATASAYVGKQLGKNQQGDEVSVKAELGSPRGYEDRLQAVAVARMSGAESTAVVQDPKTKQWHALETTAPANGIKGVEGLASFSKIDSLSKDIAQIKQDLAKPDLSDDKKKELQEKLGNDRKQMASLLFGVPDSEIRFNATESHDEPGKINIDPIDPRRKKSDVLGREHFPGDKEFEPGLQPTFAIDVRELDNPKEAAGVLFHEVSHEKDDELTQKWVQKYQDAGHTFVEGQPGLKPFRTWMYDQVGKGQPPLTKADAELVVNKAENDNATSEARSYVHSALAALQAGNGDVAIQQLKGYAAAIKDGHAANPATGSYVQTAMTDEIQAAFKQLPKPMQDKLRDAIAGAHDTNKDAWISQMKLPK